jgi:hypothetical protein
MKELQFHHHHHHHHHHRRRHHHHHHHHHHHFSCNSPILPGNSLEPTVIPTVQASSFTLQYFPYYV